MPMIYAEFNHGRWVAVCPGHLEQGIQVAEQVKPGDVFICPADYPDLYAHTLIPNPRVKGAFNSVPDRPLREETRLQAISQGAAHEIVFPDDWQEIENILRGRPVYARNWKPGTTLVELRLENERLLNRA